MLIDTKQRGLTYPRDLMMGEPAAHIRDSVHDAVAIGIKDLLFVLIREPGIQMHYYLAVILNVEGLC